MNEKIRNALMRLSMCAKEECEICKHQYECYYDKQRERAIENTNIILKELERLEDVESRHGEWIPFEYGDERWHKCTACGVADRYIEYVERPNGTTGKLVAIRNYCPNCGAKMDKE